MPGLGLSLLQESGCSVCAVKSDRVRGRGGGGGRGGRGGEGGRGGRGEAGGARTHQDFGAPIQQTAQIHWRRRNFTAGPWGSLRGSHRGTPTPPPHDGGLEGWGSVGRGLRGGE